MCSSSGREAAGRVLSLQLSWVECRNRRNPAHLLSEEQIAASGRRRPHMVSTCPHSCAAALVLSMNSFTCEVKEDSLCQWQFNHRPPFFGVPTLNVRVRRRLGALDELLDLWKEHQSIRRMNPGACLRNEVSHFACLRQPAHERRRLSALDKLFHLPMGTGELFSIAIQQNRTS